MTATDNPADLLNLIQVNEDWLILNKPAGLVCHPTKGDERSSLVGRLRLYLGEPGHLINRLDRETSGLIVAARNAQTSARLRKIWQGGSVQKTYLALTWGHPVADAGTLDAPLGRDESCEVTIKDCVRPDGAPALTTYRVIQRFTRPEGAFALLEVRPCTGRKHQIRIHLQHLGHPIVGDKLYGGDPALYLDFVYDRLTPTQRAHLIFPFHALHASQLAMSWRGQRCVFRALPEAWFLDFLPEPIRIHLERDAQPSIEISPEQAPHPGNHVATGGGEFPAGSLSAIRDRQ